MIGLGQDTLLLERLADDGTALSGLPGECITIPDEDYIDICDGQIGHVVHLAVGESVVTSDGGPWERQRITRIAPLNQPLVCIEDLDEDEETGGLSSRVARRAEVYATFAEAAEGNAEDEDTIEALWSLAFFGDEAILVGRMQLSRIGGAL